MTDHLELVVAWKSLPLKGSDYCFLWHTGEGWLLKGTAAGVLEDLRPMLGKSEVYRDENAASPSEAHNRK
jgi:hypothetical protein